MLDAGRAGDPRRRDGRALRAADHRRAAGRRGAARAGRTRPGAMLDVHLMIERPERHVADFVKAGADSITFHAEATPHVAYTAELIREQGRRRRRGDQPRHARRRAGRGGRRDRHGAVHDRQPRLGRAAVHRAFAAEDRARPRDRRRRGGRQVDGGIDPETAPVCREAGANVFVAGSAIFGAADPGEAYLAIARADRRRAEEPARPRSVDRAVSMRAPAARSRPRSRSRCAAVVR